jgi:hypothetical protein
MSAASINRYSCSDGNVQPVTPFKSTVVYQYLHGGLFVFVVAVSRGDRSWLQGVGPIYVDGVPFEIRHVLVEDVVLDRNLLLLIIFRLRSLAARSLTFSVSPIFYQDSTTMYSYVRVKSVVGNYHLITQAVRYV